jgi:hypothetical protein
MQSLVMLQAIWGPQPRWVEADPDSLIGTACHTLYAVRRSERVRYILGVVRTSLSDYPVAICTSYSQPTLIAYIPNPTVEVPPDSSVTVSEAAVASNPKLSGQIKSITSYSDDQPIKDVHGGYDSLRKYMTSTEPVVITTVDQRKLLVSYLLITTINRSPDQLRHSFSLVHSQRTAYQCTNEPFRVKNPTSQFHHCSKCRSRIANASCSRLMTRITLLCK